MTDQDKTQNGWEILSRLGDDASKWAAEFNKTAVRLGYSEMDEGWLITWFANAIEHSGDVRRWRREKLSLWTKLKWVLGLEHIG
jgi:hypothetical protein